MKKILVSLLILAMTVLALASCGIIGGNCGLAESSNIQQLDFYLKDDGTYAVGVGKAKLLSKITIPPTYNGAPVTEIIRGGFENSENLKEIVISDSVESIGDRAFYNCSSLTSVIIPDSVTSIGSSAFTSCDSLASVTIPDSVTRIGDGAFSGCSSLTSVTIPDIVTSIGYSAFSGCSSLTSVTIPDSVTSIGNYAFSACDSLTSVTIPDSVTSIGSYAFFSCPNLTIYCEAESQPSGWNNTWNYSDCPVVWGYTADAE